MRTIDGKIVISCQFSVSAAKVPVESKFVLDYWCQKKVHLNLPAMTHTKVREKYAVIQPPAVTKMLAWDFDNSQMMTPLVATRWFGIESCWTLKQSAEDWPHSPNSITIGIATTRRLRFQTMYTRYIWHFNWINHRVDVAFRLTMNPSPTQVVTT